MHFVSNPYYFLGIVNAQHDTILCRYIMNLHYTALEYERITSMDIENCTISLYIKITFEIKTIRVICRHIYFNNTFVYTLSHTRRADSFISFLLFICMMCTSIKNYILRHSLKVEVENNEIYIFYHELF